MKTLISGAVPLLLLAGLSTAQAADSAFTGEIMDSQCAEMGSHAKMMKEEGAKDAKECTLSCVKMGGKYVLFNAAKKTTYQLDDQQKPQEFAGQMVNVTGTLDKATRSIHVRNITTGS